jgi:hypothetical protein
MADATLQQGAPDTEGQFQGLWDAGAFEPETQPTEEPPEQERQETQEDPEGVEQPEEQEAEPEEAAETEDDEPSYASLDEFLTQNELNPEEFKSLNVSVKVDGETRDVPLSDVIKSFQLEGHVNNKSIELSNQRRALEQEQEQFRTAAKQQIERNEHLGNLAVEQLNYEFSQVNWNELRQEDPGQYSALMQDFQNRQNQIQQYMGEIAQQKQQQEQESQQKLAENLKQEREQLLDAIPEWRDASKFDEARKSISTYAQNLGFTDAELGQIYDHRILRVLNDAARYQALQAAKPSATKRVKTAPKMVKPGTRTNRDPSSVARQNAAERFNRNPRDLDAQVAFFSTLE